MHGMRWVGGLASWSVLVAAAQGQSDLGAKLKRLDAAAQADPALSAEFKSALSDVAQELGKSGAGGLGAWAEKLSFYGDFRLRHETDFHLDDMESRNRERFRLRIGGDYAVNDELTVGTRVVTGSPGDENSPHQNFGGTFDKASISIDRAFAKWKPAFLGGAWIEGGKFPHPFEKNPVYGEMVWDDDVQPTGVVAGGSTGIFKWVVGEYQVLDNASYGTAESAWAFVAQASAAGKVDEHHKLSGAVAFYRYGQLNPDDVNGGRFFSENVGNATKDTNGDSIADDYLSRFSFWNPWIALENSSFSQPVTVAFEWFYNPRARIAADSGYAIGVKWGKAKEKGDWLAYYNWEVMGQDAVLSNFTNDDILFGTNYKGHLVGVKWQCLDHTELHLWGSAMQRRSLGTTATTDDDKLQMRVRFDLNIRF